MRKLNNIKNNRTKKNSLDNNSIMEKKAISADNNNTNILNNTGICSNNDSEKEINLTSSSSSSCSHYFSIYKLLISNQESFTFSSCYKNLNELSKGEYIKDKKLRKETQNFLKKMQESNISSSRLFDISSIKNKKSKDSNYLKEHIFMDSNISYFDSQSEGKQSKICDQTKKSINKKSSFNLKNLSDISNEKLNMEKSYKGRESNVTEKSDGIIFEQINEGYKNQEGNSDFSSILKNIMNLNQNYHPDNQNDKSYSNDCFMENKINGNNNKYFRNDEYIKNESIKKMMLNNVIRTTNNNIFQIKQYNTMKTENNKICVIF